VAKLVVERRRLSAGAAVIQREVRLDADADVLDMRIGV
jgi:hypothetical protein